MRMSFKLKKYMELMRLHKPIPILLLLWPTLWALWIAGNGHPNFKIVMIFIAGVIIMRSAGCVINDIFDRNIDSHVLRTKARPLACKAVTVNEAMVLFVILCLGAFLLVLQLNLFTIVLAAIALVICSIYPLTKRYFYFPQLVLGIGWYIGILMAFTAQLNYLSLVSLMLYLTAIVWTIVYDTMYAMADRSDDIKIGVKSTAILFAQYDKLIIGLLQLIVLLLLILLGQMLKLSMIYYMAIVVACLLSIYQQILIRNREPKQCIKAFLNNNWFGFVIFLGLMFGF